MQKPAVVPDDLLLQHFGEQVYQSGTADSHRRDPANGLVADLPIAYLEIADRPPYARCSTTHGGSLERAACGI